MQHLRVGIVAPPWFPVPPPAYGGIERVVSYLADGLVTRGHQVTLFASGGSRTLAELSSTYANAPSKSLGNPIVEARHIAQAYDRAREFDVIHDHTMLGLLAGSRVGRPVLHTIHGAVTEPVAGFYESVRANVRFVCISQSQRSTLPATLDATVIHNAVPTSDFPFSEKPGDYLLFVGRMCPDKGIVEAIEIARRTRLPLLVLAKINEPDEHEYFAQVVRPALRQVDADLCEQPPEDVRLRAFANALAVLFPIQWSEPFGMVMIESMATGTPVIAFRRGSVPEVVVDGRTGFIVDTVEEAAAAVPGVRGLDRRDCRRHVEQHFDANLATERYEQALLELAARPIPDVVVKRPPTSIVPVPISIARAP